VAPRPSSRIPPHLLGLVGGLEEHHVGRVVGSLESVDGLFGLSMGLVSCLSAELGQQPTLALGEHRDVLGVHPAQFHVPDQLVVNAFEPDGAVL
jgi:hypothetical protein